MPSEFRFMLICRGATNRLDDRLITLSGIVNEIDVRANEPSELAVILGVILRPEMMGKRLDLMAWNLGTGDKAGQLLLLPGYMGPRLILPAGKGATVLPYAAIVPIHSTGWYGFHLYDRDGTFGPSEGLLATYMFGVNCHE